MERNEQFAALSYAVRGRVVLKYTGQLALIQAALNLIPLAVAMLYGESRMAWCFFIVSLVLAVAAAPWVRFPEPKRFLRSETLVVACLAFIIGAGAMVYPFTAAGFSFLDALFETTSGITTTGLTTMVNIGGQLKSVQFGRAWLQWCGGMGIVVLTLALLADPHIAFKHLLVPLEESEGLVTGVRFHARRAVAVYLALTACATAALRLSGLDGFSATVLALSAVSTGGFSIHDDSIATLPFVPGQLIVTLACFLGAVSLSLYHRSYTQRTWEVFSNVETRGLLLVTTITIALLALMLTNEAGLGWAESLKHAFLLGMSAQSTCGFSSLDVGALGADVKGVLIASMTIGGEMGSTAGGLKIMRLLILARLVHFAIHSSGTPSHAVLEPRLDGQRIEARALTEVLTFASLFGAVVFVSWVPFASLGHDPLDSLFEIVSAMGTVGLSTGITGHDLHPLLKGILCLDMLAGRLEIIALLVLINPRTWLGKRVQSL